MFLHRVKLGSGYLEEVHVVKHVPADLSMTVEKTSGACNLPMFGLTLPCQSFTLGVISAMLSLQLKAHWTLL